MATGRDAEAAPVLRRLIPILEKAEGVSSSEALTARCDLASTYLKLRRWDEAKEALLTIIRIGSSITTTGSPDGDENVATRFYTLGLDLVEEIGLYGCISRAIG